LLEDSFDAAVKRLNNTNLISGVYYIVSGVNPNEGVVIEREFEGAHGFYQLNETTWYLV